MSDDSPAKFFTEGRQSNPGANTLLANSGELITGGIVGANYKIGILLNGSVGMTYKLETLDPDSVIVSTLYLAAPANDAKLISPDAAFFIPNGFSVRIRNETGVLLGTLQASLILKIHNIVDEYLP